MKSKYVDRTALAQVIGSIFNSPQILDLTDKYTITEADFPDELLQVIIGSIYKIHEMGAKTISLENISDYLANKPKSQAIYQRDKGEEWLLKASEVAITSAFDFYYDRMKKMSLLNWYNKLMQVPALHVIPVSAMPRQNGLYSLMRMTNCSMTLYTILRI